jgi:hypothetical protein
MRPGQNKRLRGRTGRKGPNPLTRSFESNGPDVKIRGTAQHVAEKYLQLARDAQSSGDIVLAENLLQHAEHYFRLISAAQGQNVNGYGRQGYEADSSEDDDDDFVGIPDRFAPLSERLPPNPAFSAQQPNFQPPANYQSAAPQQQPQPQQPQFAPPEPQPQPFEERPAYGQMRQERGEGRHERGEPRQHERPVRSDRPQFGRGRNQDRNQEQGGEGGDRGQQFGYERNRERPRFQQRREPEAPQVEDQAPAGPAGASLPAFITAPPIAVAARAPAPAVAEEAPAQERGEAQREGRVGYHLSPRRRRRPRAPGEEGGAEEGAEPTVGGLPLGE